MYTLKSKCGIPAVAKKKFDREVVLDQAIDLFWQHGFHGSSMQQVTTWTGLKPGSIYLEFTNKEGLFKAALKRYAQLGETRLRQTIESAPTIEHGICNFLETVMAESEQQNYCSCFIIKTQLELSADEGSLCKSADQCLRKIEGIFQSYLAKIYDPEVSQARASSIMLHIFGLRVYGYQTGAMPRMRAGLQEGLSWLPWEQVASDIS